MKRLVSAQWSLANKREAELASLQVGHNAADSLAHGSTILGGQHQDSVIMKTAAS